METQKNIPSPSPVPALHPSNEALQAAYQQVCTSYHNVEDFRSRLLGLIPGVTAGSFIATIASNPEKSHALTNLVFPFGILGALVVLGLFFYEIENLRRATMLSIRGQWLEQAMNIVGPFAPYPDSIFNARDAAAIIYSISFAGWVCIALWFPLPGLAIYITLLVLVVCAALSFLYIRALRTRIRQEFTDTSGMAMSHSQIQ